jgi:hypothetical protein
VEKFIKTRHGKLSPRIRAGFACAGYPAPTATVQDYRSGVAITLHILRRPLWRCATSYWSNATHTLRRPSSEKSFDLYQLRITAMLMQAEFDTPFLPWLDWWVSRRPWKTAGDSIAQRAMPQVTSTLFKDARLKKEPF